MNSETGEFHDLSNPEVRERLRDMHRRMGDKVPDDLLEETLRKIGWLEFRVGEVLSIKGHDFKVLEIDDHRLILQSVKFVDPSLKK